MNSTHRWRSMASKAPVILTRRLRTLRHARASYIYYLLRAYTIHTHPVMNDDLIIVTL